MFFTRANSDYLKSTKPPVIRLPLSVSCWFNMPTAIDDSLTIWQIGDDSVTDQLIRCQVRGATGGDPYYLQKNLIQDKLPLLLPPKLFL